MCRLVLVALAVLVTPCLAQWDSLPDFEECNSTCVHREVDANRTLAESSPFQRRSACGCDEECASFGDCCSDAPGAGLQRALWSCFLLSERQDGIWVRQTCAADWTGDGRIKELCEADAARESDPVLQAPVTSSASGLSYRNVFCAICNEDDGTATPWTPSLECDEIYMFPAINDTFVRENVQLGPDNKWGLWLEVDEGREFFVCGLEYRAPTVNATYHCTPSFDSCDGAWNGTETEARCKSYTSMVYSDGFTYRNRDCAACNNVTWPLTCGVAESNVKPRYFSFNILMDFNPRRGNIVGKVSPCVEPEVYDPFYKKCRNLVCGFPGYKLDGNKCVRGGLHSRVRSGIPNVLRSGSVNRTGDAEASDDFLDCPKAYLNGDEYRMRRSGNLHALRYDRDFRPDEFRIEPDKRALVCAFFVDASSNEIPKFSPYMGYASAVGLGVSISCLVVHLLIFLVVPEMRNLSGKNLANLALALLAAYVSFVVGQLVPLRFASCRAVAVVTYYFFLASFFWTNAMAYDVWRTLRAATRELRVGSGSQWKRHFVYVFYSWSVPAVVVGLSVFFEDPSGGLPRELRPAFGRYGCWFGQRKALLVFFAGPLAAVVLVNVVLFASTAVMIVGSTKSAAKCSGGTARRNFGLYFRLSVMMGLSWTFGIVAGYLDIDVLWYLFIVLNTLEGLFIFVAFSCTSKVGSYLRDSLLACMKLDSERSATLSSASAYDSNSTTHTNLSRRSSPRNSTNYKKTAPYLALGNKGVANLDMH